MTPPRRMAVVLRRFIVLAVLGLFVSSGAAAQSSPPKLTDNRFTIDLVEGPVVGASRIVGLGGAYTALATGIDASPWNPASYGARELWEQDWFEFDVDAGFLLPALFALNDYFNTDAKTGVQYKNFYVLSFGGRFLFGNFGIGGLTRLRSFHITESTTGNEADVAFGLTNAGVAFQLFDGQLVVGAGVRIATISITDSMSNQSLVSEAGAGFEGGMLFRPAAEHWRIGAALRTPVSSTILNLGRTPGNTPREAGGFILPEDVYLPWDATVGVAVSIGDRPLNRRWYAEDYSVDNYRQLQTLARFKREREEVEQEMGRELPPDDPYEWLPQRASNPQWLRDEALRRRLEDKDFDDRVAWEVNERQKEALVLSRDYVLLSADLVFTGATENGISVEGFLAQREAQSGRDITMGVRFGAEAEPVYQWLKIRAGGYLEPSRTPTASARFHSTTGVDVRLFTWDIFGLVSPFTLRTGATLDVAPRYFDWALSLGMWH